MMMLILAPLTVMAFKDEMLQVNFLFSLAIKLQITAVSCTIQLALILFPEDRADLYLMFDVVRLMPHD